MLCLLLPLVLAAPTIVWSSPASVGQGGSARFETKGVSGGVHATHANPVLRIEDRSSPPSGRTRCRLTFVAFESL